MIITKLDSDYCLALRPGVILTSGFFGGFKMKIVVKGPVELMNERILSAVPSGSAISEKKLFAKLSRGNAGSDARAIGQSLEGLMKLKEVSSFLVAAPVLSFDPPVKYYTRSRQIHALRDQKGIDKSNGNIKEILRVEGGFVELATLFKHPTMPANWQQHTVLVRDGFVKAIGSFGEIAKAYLANIKSGRGKMVIHRLGTKFEPNPNTLLNAFKAAVSKARK
jgi:hypothetical protein